jgi:hypothetical protein
MQSDGANFRRVRPKVSTKRTKDIRTIPQRVLVEPRNPHV